MDTTEKPCYTVITGASNGLGLSVAKECAKRGMNLILVSLPGEGLIEFCRELDQDFNVSVHGYELDLTEMDAPEKFARDISNTFKIKHLINNAGLGGTVPIEMATTEYLHRIIMLNIRALSILTHLLLSNMKNCPNARIMNVSSMAAFSAIPYKTVYPASKAFVYSFSRGLDYELRKTNIKVSVLHPGNMLTNHEVVFRTSIHRKWVHSIPEKVAKIAVDGMLKGKKVIIPGWVGKLGWFVTKVIPHSIRMKLFSNIWWRECEKVRNHESYYRELGIIK